jgi:hypothetical protein
MQLRLPKIFFVKPLQWLFCLTACFVFLSIPAFTQDPEKVISIHVKDKPLATVLQMISDAGRLNLSYNPQSIEAQRHVSLYCSNLRIRDVLDQLLTPLGIEWKITENQVVLRKKAGQIAAAEVSSTAPTRHFTVSGYVRDGNSGEVLIGANIYAKGTPYGVSSNPYGFYSLTLPQGPYELVFSFLGYREIIAKKDISGDLRMNGEMEEIRLDMKEIVVRPDEAGTDNRRSQLSDFSFSNKTLASLPGFAGTPDIVKALQSVPGIRSYGDGSSLFYVRGGNSDQNLLLLDETPLFNPSHLFGFFSALSPDAVNDIQIYKGDFPARYGGRLSSVIDVKAKEGNLKRFGFGGNLGPYASTLSVEGPIWKDHASFFVSGRLSTLNWLNYLNTGQPEFNVQFFDINAKLNLQPNENNRFYLTFYTGRDDFARLNASAYRTFGISWNNILGTARWNHIFSKKLFSNTTLNYSRYNYYLYTSENQENFWTSSVEDLGLKSDFTWFLNPSNTIRAGFSVANYRSNPGNLQGPAVGAGGEPLSVSRYNSLEYILYAGNEQRIGRSVILKYGIRLPVWQDLGTTTVYQFDQNHSLIDSLSYGNYVPYFTALSFEPRFSVIYNPSDHTSLRFSYTRNNQFLQQLTNSTGPFTSLDVWVPSGPNIPVQKADQWALGYYQKIKGGRVQASAEVFYKTYYDHLDYKDHANLLYNPYLESELRFGKAWAYGLELLLRKPDGKLTGWIAYTWSRSLVQTDEINGGAVYPANYDSPNDVCINLSYDTRKHWAFSAVWYYHTGSPVTTPTSFYYNNGISVPIYGSRNNSRLPDYHRLDLSVTYRISRPEKRFQQNLILTLYNAYGRNNPFGLGFNRYMDASGNLVVPANLDAGYQIVPTAISVAGIIPSINYQFKF